MSNPLQRRLQNMAGGMGGGAAAGSSLAATAGLVDKRGNMMPPSTSYLAAQAQAEIQADKDRAWKHYTGRHHDHFFRSQPGQPDMNVLSNRASTIVDTGVDFLYGKTVTLEVQKDGKAQKDAQEALDQCWGNDARRMTTMSKLGQNGGIFGHVFAKILPPTASRKFCRIIPLDPAQITVETEAEDCDTVRAYVIEWQQPDDMQRDLALSRMQVIKRLDPDDPDQSEDNNDLYSYDSDAQWMITNYLRLPNNQWVMIGQPIMWEHQWAPVVDWQNLPLANTHWGQSDIPENIQHLNSVLNLTLSNINAIAKFYGFPWLYATNVNPNEVLDVGPGRLTKFPSPDAKITALEAHGDIANLLGFSDSLRADMDEQTRVPAVATGRLRDVPRVTSGVAFQMMYGPLLGKTVHKQRLYETGHEELSLRMLSLMGYGDGTGLDGWAVVTHWPSPLPNDDQSTAQLALAASQVGMSEHFVIAEVFGQDYDAEMEYRKQEAKEELKNAMQGAAMPDPNMPPGNGPVTAQGGQQGGDNPQQGNTPPTNHPAAVAARNVAKAAGKAIKAGAKS